MKDCTALEIKGIFTGWSNPEVNAVTEKVIRNIQENLVWQQDWEHPFHFQRTLVRWVYNYNYPHQSLDYQTTCEYYEQYVKNTEKIIT